MKFIRSNGACLAVVVLCASSILAAIQGKIQGEVLQNQKLPLRHALVCPHRIQTDIISGCPDLYLRAPKRTIGNHFSGLTIIQFLQKLRLLKVWPPNGPLLIWEVKKGSGFSGPAISGERLYSFTDSSPMKSWSACIRKPAIFTGNIVTPHNMKIVTVKQRAAVESSN